MAAAVVNDRFRKKYDGRHYETGEPLTSMINLETTKTVYTVNSQCEHSPPPDN